MRVGTRNFGTIGKNQNGTLPHPKLTKKKGPLAYQNDLTWLRLTLVNGAGTFGNGHPYFAGLPTTYQTIAGGTSNLPDKIPGDFKLVEHPLFKEHMCQK